MTGNRKKKSRAALIVTVCVCALLLACLAAFWARGWAPKKQRLIYPLEYRQELLAAAEEFDIDPNGFAPRVVVVPWLLTEDPRNEQFFRRAKVIVGV